MLVSQIALRDRSRRECRVCRSHTSPLAVVDGDVELVGINSTSSADLDHNGIVALSSIARLLEHRSSHTYPVSLVDTATSAARVVRS